MTKKVLAFILIVLAIVVIVGCSKSSSGSSSTAASSSGSASNESKLSGNLNIWAWGADTEAIARKDAIEVFIKGHPELKVTYTVIPTADSVWDQKQAAALASGSAGDVMQMSPDYFGMNTKYYINLNPYIERDNIDIASVITPGMIDRYYDTDGKLEAFPLHTNCFVMAYNKDMFAKAGVEAPKDGWTFEDLLNWGKKFATGTGAQQTYALVKHWCMNNYIIYSEGGTPYTSDLKTSNMGSEEIVKALTLYKKLIGEGIIPTDTAQDTIPAETLFVSGKAAMYPMGGFESSTVVTDAEENGINLGFCSMPSDPQGKEINVQYATGWAISTTCKNPDAAWQFLKESAFANDEMGKINARVGIPANKKIAETYYADLVAGKVKFTNDYYVQHISKAHMNPFGGTLASAGTIWSTMVEAVTLDNQDPAATVEKYAPQIAREFASYSFNQK